MRSYTNENCMTVLKRLKNKEVDLAIVDPPYGINAGKMTMGAGSGNDTGKHNKKDWDQEIPSPQYFKELFRVSKNQIIWGGNYFIEHLYNTSCLLLWDKKDYNSDFASHEVAWTSFKSPVKCFIRARSKGNDNKGKIHPTQKPIALYKWILSNYSKKGDIILDTHAGSCSSLIACEELGFDYIACELDPDYYAESCKRIETYRSNLKLF